PRLPRRLTGPRRYRRSTTKTGILLHPNRDSSRTVGAPAPGAKALWLDSLSHRGRCSYTQTGILLHQNRGSLSNGRSTRPGCEGVLVRLPFAPRAVLLHLDRDSPASKPGFFSNRRSTRPGCEGVLARLPFAPRAVLLHPNRDSPASKPGVPLEP